MEGIKHIFFDLDHTLWDFEKNSSETLGELYDEFNLHPQIQNKERFLATYQTVNAQYWKKYRQGKIDKQTVRFGRFEDTLKRFKVVEAERLGREIGDLYVQRGPLKTQLLPFALDALKHLNTNYPLHIITNGFRESQTIKMTGSKLHPYFDIVLCSEEVGVNKPHPLVFETALRKAAAAPHEAVMIGDNYQADILGAKKAGMKTIFFDPKKSHPKPKSPVIHCLKDLITLFS
ncbi:MAG: YjjG family noncanonical pyrimidine nucleotidase [Crocinitomicaceae bacterium]